MSAFFGFSGILLALISSGAIALRGFLKADKAGLRLPVLGLLIGSIVAMGALELALLTNDFSVSYVAAHHARSTPLIYAIATAWAALEGSIVLWGLVLAVFTFAMYRRDRLNDTVWRFALATMGVISLFFFGMMATIANPFEVCTAVFEGRCIETTANVFASSVALLDGPGPNPLLQNHILMAVHPPVLYLGYVGFAVPFAYAIGTLMAGGNGTAWLERTRRWTLAAWTFLTLGIVLGALWSYAVLNWGGYWAWDPVENASFLPWLAGTAFLHSSVVERKRGMLRTWNVALVIATFELTILGTFLTRSGVVASVHSFTQSAVGPAILMFLIGSSLAAFGLFAARSHLIVQSPRIESLASREGVFLLNNLLLTVFAFAVLAGTMYPMLLEAFTGDQVSVGRPFFDAVASPISYVLLLAIGIGPVTPYRIAGAPIMKKRLVIPAQIALAAGAISVLSGRREFSVVVVIMLATFIVAVITKRFAELVTARPEPGLQAASHVLAGDPGFWGGQISHIGVAVLALGLTVSSALGIQASGVLEVGETITIDEFTLTNVGVFERTFPGKVSQGVTLELRRKGEAVDLLEPHLSRFNNQGPVVGTPGIHVDVTGDVYASINALDASDGSVGLDVSRYPYLFVMWVGGFVIVMGGTFSTIVRRRSRRDVAPVAVS
ncbi:MAG: cytochrome c biogenesis protein CcsA [Acidimicrobiia bacterium]|nr:cytochrome c biogenesis protein CcsA [Acidimicrobiia bacterium]MBT8249997.1 cytochrome c biogenesis protein CcsA [Acidimicrobiia bacterium]NNC41743.1 heme lyase CcmF/NrfE family subunit [Acidimicrobiia bacterium]NNL28166.1 heme lyase CcmF/NrfE family subunit [Acidimicrobiia bacterium]